MTWEANLDEIQELICLLKFYLKIARLSDVRLPEEDQPVHERRRARPRRGLPRREPQGPPRHGQRHSLLGQGGAADAQEYRFKGESSQLHYHRMNNMQDFTTRN